MVSYARNVVADAKKRYPDIICRVVIAYLPKDEEIYFDGVETIFSEGIEKVPKRYAIDWRNRWLVEHSNYVVTYVKRSFGGAAKFKDLAEKKKRVIFNIASIESM